MLRPDINKRHNNEIFFNIDVIYFQLFINNEFVDSVSCKKFPTINPADGTIIVQISEGDKVLYFYFIIFVIIMKLFSPQNYFKCLLCFI